MTPINVKITCVEDGYVFFQEIDGDRIKRASSYEFAGDASIRMRPALLGAHPGMTMEIDFDFENYAYGPIKGARLITNRVSNDNQ